MDQERTYQGTRQAYRIESVLGRGAMGVVYEGTSEKTLERVAIKTLRPDLLQGSERGSVMERFVREAAVSMEMNHPNIVRVLDSGKEEEGTFLVMELIQGKELKGLLDKAEAIPMEITVRIMDQLLAALDHAHQHGVVHRDIKPANILVDNDFSLKITDFGISSVESSEMTQAGTLLGTPAFMSPEQIVGEPVDRRADLFSAGVLLYQLLTGEKPFTGQLTTILYKILHETPPPPSSLNDRVPANLDAVVMKALAKKREERFDDAASFAEALRKAWDEARAKGLASEQDEAKRGSAGDAVPDSGRGPKEAPKSRRELRRRMEEVLLECLENAVTPRLLTELQEGFQTYRDLLNVDPGKAPGLAEAVAADRDRFGEMALDRLKDLIIREAPVPGKTVKPGARNDWMLCIDLFRHLGDFIVRTGGEDRTSVPAGEIRSRLMSAAMMYVDQISGQLSASGPIELFLISADFMRLDILEWGLEELGGDEDVRRMRWSIRRFAGQVLERVNGSIRDFLQSREVLARQDVAELLSDIDELIVIATRIIEPTPQAGGSGAPFAPDGTDLGVIRTFIDNAAELSRLFMEELKQEVTGREADVMAFQNKLKQLGRLYRFSVLFDDPACRRPLHDLTDGVHSSIEALYDTLKKLLREAECGPSRDEAYEELLQKELTVVYELAEELGWIGFCERVMTELRDGFLKGAATPVETRVEGHPEPAEEAPEQAADMTLMADRRDVLVEEGTLMYTDVRSSKAMMEAIERESRRRAGPAPGTGGEKATPATALPGQRPEEKRAAPLGRLLRRLLVLAVALGLGLGGVSYYRTIYQPEKTRQQIIQKHSAGIVRFIDDDEFYGPYREREIERQTDTLTSMLNDMEQDGKTQGAFQELETLEATVRLMILERDVRRLLEEGRAQKAMQRIEQAKADLPPVGSSATLALHRPFTSLAGISELLDLLMIVCRYRQFQLAYPDPYHTDPSALNEKALDDILRAKRLKDDFAVLRKRNSMTLSATFRYLEGMVNEVDEYGITLVNRWYHHVFSEDTP